MAFRRHSVGAGLNSDEFICGFWVGWDRPRIGHPSTYWDIQPGSDESPCLIPGPSLIPVGPCFSLLFGECLLLKRMPSTPQAEPLYELVTATDFAYSSAIRQNMKQALEEFQKEVSPCHCAPCQGNGVPVLKGTVSRQLASLRKISSGGAGAGASTPSNPHTLWVSQEEFQVNP